MNPLVEWKLRNPGQKPERKDKWLKLRENPTRKTAIDAFCIHCMGWEEGQEKPPRIVEDVKSCTSKDCPLHEFRPYK
jgi:hypothetical protein